MMRHLAMRLLIEGDAAHADRVDFAWGHAFHDAKNPLCHAANHAVAPPGADLSQALAQTRAFYDARGLTPRLIALIPAVRAQDTLACIRRQLWRADLPDMRLLALADARGPAQSCPEVVRMRGLFGEAMEFSLELLGLWGAQALKRRLRLGEACQVYMLMLCQRPVAMGVLRYMGEGNETFALIEDVAVLPQMRRMGLATRLLRHIMDRHFKQKGALPILLSAHAQLARSLYAPLGFAPVTGLPVQVCAAMREPTLFPEEP